MKSKSDDLPHPASGRLFACLGHGWGRGGWARLDGHSGPPARGQAGCAPQRDVSSFVASLRRLGTLTTEIGQFDRG